MKMMRWLSRKKLNNKGMSLVEIIVAVAVFTVVAIPVMKIFASSNGTNSKLIFPFSKFPTIIPWFPSSSNPKETVEPGYTIF